MALHPIWYLEYIMSLGYFLSAFICVLPEEIWFWLLVCTLLLIYWHMCIQQQDQDSLMRLMLSHQVEQSCQSKMRATNTTMKKSWHLIITLDITTCLKEIYYSHTKSDHLGWKLTMFFVSLLSSISRLYIQIWNHAHSSNIMIQDCILLEKSTFSIV